MWDGFWVHQFKRGVLVVSCSFDSIYYREYDIIFKGVVFFNLPHRWKDTAVKTPDFMRLSSKDEFYSCNNVANTDSKIIVAFDLFFQDYSTEKQEFEQEQKQTFFVVAEHIYLNKCTDENNNPAPEYQDAFINEKFPCKKNRVMEIVS